MIMLDQLKEKLDDIADVDDWAFEFITDVLIRKEENPDYKLTKNQFNKLVEFHEKYYLKY